MSSEELQSSELGTQEYWQKTYASDIRNYDNHGDPGDVWFGEDSAYRVIKWINNCGVQKDVAVIDLGCGNGYTLTELAREGFTNLLGVDYCEEAITLATKVAEKEFPFIEYKVFDITKNDISVLEKKFTIVHDKGTYDAISLNPNEPKRQREEYIRRVKEMLTDDGYFVITSCNWTEDELVEHMKDHLKFHCVIPSPKFQFGGKVGNLVSAVVFKRLGDEDRVAS